MNIFINNYQNIKGDKDMEKQKINCDECTLKKIKVCNCNDSKNKQSTMCNSYECKKN